MEGGGRVIGVSVEVEVGRGGEVGWGGSDGRIREGGGKEDSDGFSTSVNSSKYYNISKPLCPSGFLMYVSVCLFVRLLVRVVIRQSSVRLSVHTAVRLFIWMCVYLSVWMCVCRDVCVLVRVDVRVLLLRMYVDVWMYVCLSVWMYVSVCQYVCFSV